MDREEEVVLNLIGLINKSKQRKDKLSEKNYDRFVLDGGSDVCYRYGISGNCGCLCEAYGSKPECAIDREEAS